MTTCQLTKIEECDGFFRAYYLTVSNGVADESCLIVGATDAVKLANQYGLCIHSAA